MSAILRLNSQRMRVVVALYEILTDSAKAGPPFLSFRIGAINSEFYFKIYNVNGWLSRKGEDFKG